MARIIKNLGKKSPYNNTSGFLVLFLVISIIFLTGCSSLSGDESSPTATAAEIEKTEPVQTQEVAGATPDEAGNAGGTKVSLKDHFWLLESLGGKQVLDDTYITAELDSELTGIAGCNEYRALYEQRLDTFRIRMIVPVEGQCRGQQGLMEQEYEYLFLLDRSKTFAVEDGQLKLFNQDGQPILVYNAVVLGSISSDLSEPLPENAVVKVILTEIGSSGTDAVILAEESITDQSNSPISFTLAYDPAKIDPTREYVLSVEIYDSNGELVFSSPSSTPTYVLTQNNPSVVSLFAQAIQ